MHVAGKHLSFIPADHPFLAALDEERWDEEDREHHASLVKKGQWDATYGDRNSKLVFIGVNLDKELIHKKLSEALLTQEESDALGGVEGWRNLNDPFFEGVGDGALDFFEIDYDEVDAENGEKGENDSEEENKRKRATVEDGASKSPKT
jgi:hypothetical protein